jgi:hypothetical protein
MLAKAADALIRERSQKHKNESVSKSYTEEKEFLCEKSLKTIQKAATF